MGDEEGRGRSRRREAVRHRGKRGGKIGARRQKRGKEKKEKKEKEERARKRGGGSGGTERERERRARKTRGEGRRRVAVAGERWSNGDAANGSRKGRRASGGRSGAR